MLVFSTFLWLFDSYCRSCIRTFLTTLLPPVCEQVPCVLRVLFVSKGMLATPAAVSKLVLSGLVGLTPYAYLPIASQYAYPGSWGDLRTVQVIGWELLRRKSLFPDLIASVPTSKCLLELSDQDASHRSLLYLF